MKQTKMSGWIKARQNEYKQLAFENKCRSQAQNPAEVVRRLTEAYTAGLIQLGVQTDDSDK